MYRLGASFTPRILQIGITINRVVPSAVSLPGVQTGHKGRLLPLPVHAFQTLSIIVLVVSASANVVGEGAGTLFLERAKIVVCEVPDGALHFAEKLQRVNGYLIEAYLIWHHHCQHHSCSLYLPTG